MGFGPLDDYNYFVYYIFHELLFHPVGHPNFGWEGGGGGGGFLVGNPTNRFIHDFHLIYCISQ